MALIEFENNTAPYLNAANLNNNFNYLDEKIDIGKVYSTDETIIGTWIDGKPIYRKVVNFTTIAGSNDFQISEISTVIDTIVKLNCIVTQPSGNPVPVPYYIGSTDYANFYINISNNRITFRCGSSYGFGNNKLIIEYTKTTD